MSHGFRAYAPSHAYALKLRWIVSGLSGVVVLLVGLLVVVLQSQRSSQSNPIEPVAAYATVTTHRDILVSAVRIEKGMIVEPAMLKTVSIASEDAPSNVIFADRSADIVGRYASEMIVPGAPLQSDFFSESTPFSLRDIPDGQRAVTIAIDSRAGVAWHIKPFDRVDVLCAFVGKDGQHQLATVVRYAKVFSIDGETRRDLPAGGSASKTVTLTVSEKDSKRIELARNIGTLSLTLVGGTSLITGPRSEAPIKANQLFGEIAQTKDEKPRNVIYFRDPITHQLKTFYLKNNEWIPESELKVSENNSTFIE